MTTNTTDVHLKARALAFRGQFSQSDITNLRSLENGDVWQPIQEWRPFLTELAARLRPLVEAQLLDAVYPRVLEAIAAEPATFNAASHESTWIFLRKFLEPFVLPPT